jgi:hypothetical protein
VPPLFHHFSSPVPPSPSLPCCRRPKEGERAARPAAQLVLALARVFLHTHGWAPPLCCILMMASAILRHGGSKREGEKREETPSLLSSLRGASLASCVASRDNLGETSPACSMVFFLHIYGADHWVDTEHRLDVKSFCCSTIFLNFQAMLFILIQFSRGFHSES